MDGFEVKGERGAKVGELGVRAPEVKKLLIKGVHAALASFFAPPLGYSYLPGLPMFLCLFVVGGTLEGVVAVFDFVFGAHPFLHLALFFNINIPQPILVLLDWCLWLFRRVERYAFNPLDILPVIIIITALHIKAP